MGPAVAGIGPMVVRKASPGMVWRIGSIRLSWTAAWPAGARGWQRSAPASRLTKLIAMRIWEGRGASSVSNSGGGAARRAMARLITVAGRGRYPLSSSVEGHRGLGWRPWGGRACLSASDRHLQRRAADQSAAEIKHDPARDALPPH